MMLGTNLVRESLFRFPWKLMLFQNRNFNLQSHFEYLKTGNLFKARSNLHIFTMNKIKLANFSSTFWFLIGRNGSRTLEWPVILSIFLNFGRCLINLYQTLSSHNNLLKVHSSLLMIWKRWASEINSRQNKLQTQWRSSTLNKFSKSNNTTTIKIPTTSLNTSVPISIKNTVMFNKINNNHTKNNSPIIKNTIIKISNSSRITMVRMINSTISLSINNNNSD